MIKGTTSSGFEFEFNEESIDDMEFVEMIAKADDNISLVPELLNWMLGEELKKKLYDHVKGMEGRAKPAAVMREIEEMFEAGGDAVKNLFSSPE